MTRVEVVRRWSWPTRVVVTVVCAFVAVIAWPFGWPRGRR